MARNRRFARRFRRAKREYIWTTVTGQLGGISSDGTFNRLTLVSKADWARDATNTATLEKGAVLLRTVGGYGFRATSGAALPATDLNFSWLGVFRRTDEDDLTVHDLTNFASEDILHMDSGMIGWYPAPAGVAPTNDQAMSWKDIDIRTKRKLTSDQLIEFDYELSEFSAANIDFQLTFAFRSLIQLP